MSLFNKINDMAKKDAELNRVRAILKAGATVLSKAGFPTKVTFGAPTARASASGRTPSGKRSGPPGAPIARAKGGGKKKAGKLKRKSDGSYYFDEDPASFEEYEQEQDAVRDSVRDAVRDEFLEEEPEFESDATVR